MNISQLVELDIWNWIKEYIEVEHQFYDYKFAPCPYAKAAREKGRVSVKAYESGNIKEFISSSVRELVADPKHTVAVIALPPRSRWTFWVRRLTDKLNAEVIPQGYYIQHGIALNTSSKYSGLFNSGKYFVIIINQLGPILEGHKILSKTDYYKSWPKKQYNIVVTRRQKLYDKYKDGDKKRCPFHRFML